MTQYIWQLKEWPNFTWDDNALLRLISRCRLEQGKLLAKMSFLGLMYEQQAQTDMLLEEAINTSAIEGKKLNRDLVRSSIARKLGLPSAGLPADRHADGLIDVLLDATQNHSQPLTKERLFAWNAALFPTGYSGLHQIVVGNWRGPEPMRVVSGRIGHETIHYEAMPFDQIEVEMNLFLEWWKKSFGGMEGIIRAAVAHFWFVTIHPFEDGNGRIARALIDMALAQDDNQHMRYYSLSSRINKERDSYYNVLELTQKGSINITSWIEWFLGCFSRSIVNSENIITLIFNKAAFWNRHSQTELTDRQRKVINKLLDAGKGGFEGKLTNRKYASLTKVSRATATRELQRLVELNVIKPNPGKGRSVSYDLVW